MGEDTPGNLSGYNQKVRPTGSYRKFPERDTKKEDGAPSLGGATPLACPPPSSSRAAVKRPVLNGLGDVFRLYPLRHLEISDGPADLQDSIIRARR